MESFIGIQMTEELSYADQCNQEPGLLIGLIRIHISYSSVLS